MQSAEIRSAFLNFFKEKGHTIIPSVSLIPENDPTVLFTTAGMHPLAPFLLGEKHPGGARLANVQICIRTDDIDEVGDETHHTFFEMLGNWSLGDASSPDGVGRAGYWKKEAIVWSYEFLTSKKWLGLDPDKLAVSVFAGDQDASTGSGQAPRDDESKSIWLDLGIPEERIKYLGRKDNWWGPAGKTGPCGPDTEMFYWTGEEKAPKEFDPKDNSDARSEPRLKRRGKWVEIWNDVFMEYFKNMDGKYEPLAQKNVDTGVGFERVLSAINGSGDNYKTDVFWPIIQKIEELSGKKYDDNKKEFRIIADHIKAAAFIIGDKNGVEPSNLGRGYVVRRLIRRVIRHGKTLDLSGDFLTPLVKKIVEIYGDFYTEIKSKENYIIEVIRKEAEKFERALCQGLREFGKLVSGKIEEGTTFPNSSEINPQSFNAPKINGKDLFVISTTYGFPLEMCLEELNSIINPIVNNKITFDIRKIPFGERLIREFNEEFKKHQELSRTASAGMFKGGLADSGEKAAEYHTATHLLLAALREALGDHVCQRGSNINA
ncbi:MAG: alanine--tRNA ligase, partial [Patescibacteria group bacterium]